MPRKSKIATKTEVLETLTEILRGGDGSDEGSNIKTSERISAAEKLYKILKDESAEQKDEKQYGVVILPEIKHEEDRT